MAELSGFRWQWLRNGDEIFPALLAALAAAKRSIRLEIYIFGAKEPGESVRRELIAAAQRGVRVQVLVDALGSYELSGDFWKPLRAAGADVRIFNPISLRRFGIRDHRKILVCDDSIAFIGGFNVADEYLGDGVTRGWCDLGMRLEEGVAWELALAFDDMFARADFQHKRFHRLRRAESKRTVATKEMELLLNGPGRGQSPIQRALFRDLREARDVRLVVPYFLPARKIRRAVERVAKRGGQVQIILPGKSDVALSQLAGRSLYRRLLKAGVGIAEYEPQILHLKLFIVDDVVYVGSANLDVRSLDINYEVMVRFDHAQMAAEARQIFDEVKKHAPAVELEQWRKCRTLWTRMKQRWAHFFLTRVDPYIARQQWRDLPD